MSEKKLKVVILTHGGANRLIELLHALDEVEIAGVFIETKTEPQRSFKEKLKRSIRYDGYVATARKFSAKIVGKSDGAIDAEQIQASQAELEAFVERFNIPVFRVENYHHQTAIDLIRQTDADLGILYGTNIVKQSVFGIPSLGSINIHQGLAPVYRGGPTVFWELLNDEKEIGITVHFVAAKVDTGDIILQKTLPLAYDFERYSLNYDEFLAAFRARLKEPSAQLIVEAVRLIATGEEQRIKQDTSVGKRYRLPTKTEKDQLLRVLKKRRRRQQNG